MIVPWMFKPRVHARATLASVLIALGAPTLSYASDYPLEYVKRPQVVLGGMVQLQGNALINLSNGEEFRPVILAPRLDIGLTDDLQLSYFQERGFCVNDCTFFRDLGLEAKYLFVRQESFSFSVFGGSKIDAFDPFVLQARAGLGFWVAANDQFAINGSLATFVGITNRQGNPDMLVFKLQPAFNITPEFAVFFNTGFTASFQQFGDAWRIPLGLGAVVSTDEHVDVGASFDFPTAIAGSRCGLAARTFELFGRYRFE
jgi:hypothetical protein